MTKRVGSDGEVETQPLCQRLQTVVESSESGLVFTVGSLILPLLITVKNAEKVVGTAGTGRLPVPELVEHLLCTVQNLNAHGSLRLDTIVAQHVAIKSGFLQMAQIGERHPAELEHQSSDSLGTAETVRLGIFIKKPAKSDDGKRPFLTHVHPRIDLMKQAVDIRSTAGFHTPIIDTPKHTHIRGNRIGLQTTFVKVLFVTAKTLTGDLTERHTMDTTKLAKRKKGVLIDVRCRIAALLSQTADIDIGTSTKSIFIHYLHH
jgi:hypothetical protein